MSSSLDALLPVIRSQFGQLRLPTARDKVYKDECLFSFDTPFSSTGLYVNLSTWAGFGEHYYLEDAAKTGHKLYLHEKWDQVEKKNPEPDSENLVQAAEVTTLAIGVPGGFMSESKYEIVKTHALVVLTDSGGPVSVPLPCAELPEFVSDILQAVIDHDGMRAKMQLDTWSADQEIAVSKYAMELPQLQSGKKIAQDPKTWVCEASGQTENLWLNLSTGYIGGGRRNWDGSGGSGAALQHYLDTGKQFPLCVKLGTITRHGGDVWSYSEEEDCLVKDPLLAQHLSHWGIDAMQLEKTDKTMGEMEVDLNVKYDWSKILESGEQLETLTGPGHVGLKNVGSSCYLNSVVQCLLSLPEVATRYSHFDRPEQRQALVASCGPDATQDFLVQLNKLCQGLLSERYVVAADADAGEAALEKYVVAPLMFKQLVGKDHAEFSSGRQQDAAEYFEHLLQFMSRAERTLLARLPPTPASAAAPALAPNVPTASIFEFHAQERDVCQVTQQVRRQAPALENTLRLDIPLDRAVNRDQVEEMEKKKAKVEGGGPAAAGGGGSAGAEAAEEVKLQVPLQACLENHFATNIIEGATNPSLGYPAPRLRQTLLKTFPRYLMIKLNRYVMGPNWVSVKVDASVPVPETIDLTPFRAPGPSDDEVEMPTAADAAGAGAGSGAGAGAGAGAAAAAPDPEKIEQLVGFGFTERQAAAALGSRGGDVGGAADWLFGQESLDEAVAAYEASVAGAGGGGGGGGGGAAAAADPASLEQLGSYGFTPELARAALMACGGDLPRAADWLFSRDDLDAAVAAVLSEPAPGAAGAGGVAVGGGSVAVMDDGPGTYTLTAIISHIGRSTDHGHYVCHIKKGGRWVLFNDEKVALSKAPPLDAGFMYLFRRDG